MKANLQDEENLVRALRAGSSSAFTRLYDSYSPALFGVLLRVIKDQQRAEDLLQDAFVKIFSNIHTYNSEQGRLFTWMLSITRNLALDELRVSKVKQSAQSHLRTYASDSCFPAVNEGPLYNSLLSHLAPKHREVVELVYYRNYTKQEVADELKLPLGTVKTRFRMALQQLKQLFSQDIYYYHAGLHHN